MNTSQNVSFIIPAYNSETTLEESVNSILNGNIQEGDEIIIIDDASKDGTVALIEMLTKKHPRIKSVRHLHNKGTAAAGRNTGIDVSKNELIFCLDSDNLLIPGSVDKLKTHLLGNKADAAAFGKIYFFEKDPQDPRSVTHSWTFKENITFADCLAGVMNPLSSGNYLFTKESWKKAGRYFEPNLINQTLDSWTFGIRQLGTGAKFITLADTHYLHRYGHQSHFMREYKNNSVSLAATVAIMPFLDKIKMGDVNYILSEKNRLRWFKRLDKRPLRLKTDRDTRCEERKLRVKNIILSVLRKLRSIYRTK